MTLDEGIFWSTVLLPLFGCGSKEGPPVPVVSDNQVVSVKEMFEVIKTECYQRTSEFELQHEEQRTKELLAAAADEKTLMEYLAISHVTYAEFDLVICRRYAQCYDLTDDERPKYVVQCIEGRTRDANKFADF